MKVEEYQPRGISLRWGKPPKTWRKIVVDGWSEQLWNDEGCSGSCLL